MLACALETEPDFTGRRIGKGWSLTRLIGHGGMASVYEAENDSGRRVAIKLLHQRFTSDDRVLRRFAREARLANSIPHPAVVPVEEVEPTGETPYLVMELLQGESLEAKLQREGVLPLHDVLRIIDGALEVLIQAHARKVLHRDIKPANLYLERSGRLRVLDFGVGSLPENVHSTLRTSAGSLLGTPAFMAPEQARADWERVSEQSDLWSLGATAFTLLSGRMVHEGRTANEVLGLTMTCPARSIACVLSGLPPAVVAFVDRSLQFEPALRWANAREMRASLQPLLANAALQTSAVSVIGPSAPPVYPVTDASETHDPALGTSIRHRMHGRRLAILIAAVVLLVAAGVSVYWGTRGDASSKLPGNSASLRPSPDERPTVASPEHSGSRQTIASSAAARPVSSSSLGLQPGNAPRNNDAKKARPKRVDSASPQVRAPSVEDPLDKRH